MKSKVYVVQDQRVLRGGSLVSKFDLTPASAFGELMYVLPSSAKPYHAASVIEEIHTNLREITERDYVLLVGNPILIGWVVAISAFYLKGSIQCLQWEHSKQSYIPVAGELYTFS